ncbi:MAG: sulfotransferase [Phycisphaerales bacterium]
MAPTPNQREAAAHYQRGMVSFQSGRLQPAIADFSHAAKIAQDPVIRGGALRQLGFACAQAHLYEQAIDALRQAEPLRPKDASIPMMLAMSLHSLERVNESAQACERAQKLEPGNVRTLALLVDCLVRAKRHDEARKRVEQADRMGIIDPGLDEAFGLLAMRTGDEDVAVARIKRHLDNESIDAKTRTRMLYLLGDLLDQAERYDEAWEMYDAANRSQDETFDPEKWLGSLEELRRAWTPELVRALQDGASDDERPVLIVGMPRSGTTLAELTVGRHPGVTMGGEMTVLGQVYRMLLAKTGLPADLRPDALTPALTTEAASLYSGVLNKMGLGAQRVTNKMPMNVPMLGLFAAMFPRGTIIHCRRDPRDVCLSCYFRNFKYDSPFTQRPEWLAAYYEGYAALIAHWGRVFSELDRAPRLHELTYEEMVADHESHARALIDALGLEWNDACLDVGGAQREAATLRTDQVGKGVYQSSAGRHARYAARVGPWEHLRAPSFSDGAAGGPA